MPRPIRVSVPRHLLHRDDPTCRAYLSAIAERGLSIELFTPPREQLDGPLSGFMHEEQYNESAVQLANSIGLSVDSVHMTPLVSGCSRNGARICADKVKDAMLGYSDTDSSDEIDRYRYCEPDTAVFHPPRLPQDDTAELDIRRQQLVATLGNATLRLQNEDEIQEVPTITIENVCPRGSFTYLLTDSTDVDHLETAHSQLQADQDEDVTVPPVAYTLDVGHAADPFAMLESMGAPAHVHLHGSTTNTDTARRQLGNTYNLDADDTVGTVEPDNNLQHLPPEAGDVSVELIVKKLLDVEYSGPIVLELIPSYWTAETLHSSVDLIRDAGW